MKRSFSKFLVGAVAAALLSLVSANSFAALAITISKLTDGTGTCTLDPTTVINGQLCTNDEARYNVAYSINPPPTDQSNVVLLLTIPATEPFRFTKASPGLASCINQSTAVSVDGKTITCQLKGLAPNPVNGPIGNQAADIVFDLLTTKAAKNGDVLTGVTGKITSTENPTGAISTALGVTVVAQPQLNLFKKLNAVSFAVAKPTGCTSAGSTGILIDFQVGLDLANIKGHEALADGWSYTENMATLHPNACLYDVLSGTARGVGNPWPVGLVANPDQLNAAGGSYTYTSGATGSTVISASTVDAPNTSGDVVGATSGYTKVTGLHYVRVWVADADAASSTLNDPCTFSGSNSISGFDPNGLSGASNLGPAVEDTTDNSAVVGPYPLCSGSGEKLFTSNTKGASKSIFQAPPRMSNEVTGPNDFVDSYVYWSNSGFQPRAHSHCDKWDNRKLQLDLLDPALHASDYSPATGTGNAYQYQTIPASGAMTSDTSAAFSHIWISSPGLTRGASNTVGEFEYGFIGAGTYTDQQLRSATCNNGDSTLAAAAGAAGSVVPASGWVTQSVLKANPALVPFVNALRSLDVVIPPGGLFQIFSHYKVLAANPFTSVVWPDGTIIPNYWSFQTDAGGYTGVAPGTATWASSPNSHVGNDPLAVPNTGNFCDPAQQIANPGSYCDNALVDRLRLATESVGVRKGIAGFDPNGGPLSDAPIVPKAKGDVLTYQLWPVLTAKSASVTINNDIILEDTLPAGMKYVPLSAKYNGVPIAAADVYVLDNAPAASTIKFIVRNVVAVGINSAVIPPLEFDAEVMLDDPLNVANRSLPNKVVIQACAPGAALSSSSGAVTCNVQTASQTLAERTANRTIQLAPTGALLVQKSVIGGSSKEIGSSFTMGLRYLNAGSAAVAEHRLIDILPYNSEPNRGFPNVVNDATSFNGTRPLASVTTAAASDQVFYTLASPGSIDLSPKCESNTGVGPGAWPAFAPGVPPTAGCAGVAGATTWVAATGPGPTFTGIPSTATAILVVDKTNFTVGAPSRLVTMTFSTPGSKNADRYSNNVSAANGGPGTSATAPGDGATFNTFSNNVTVRVFSSSIQGTAFVDPNANGGTSGFLPGEDTGLPGVTMTLLKGTTTIGTALTASAAIPAGQFYNPATGLAETTASATNCPVPATGLPIGGYLFCNLLAGNDYSVVETQPAGYLTTGNKAGTSAGTVGTTGAATERITAISLGPNQAATGYDFGEVAVTSVSGRVYVEKNANTTDDGNATDPGIGGVSMQLTYTPPGGGAAVTLTTTTNPDGTYTFANLPVGATSLTITEAQPLQYGNAYNTPGTSATNGNNQTTITIATLPAGGSPNNNFAETTGSVAGKVYNQGTNAGIAGQTIKLDGQDAAGNPVSLTAITDASGNYTFPNVPLSGTAGYTITQPAQPPGTQNGTTSAGSTGGVGSNPATGATSQITGVQVSGNTGAVPDTLNSVNNNFGEVVGTTISGTVYADTDVSNTLTAADTRLGGVTVTLYAADGTTVVATKQTQPDGTYTFTAADGVIQGQAYVIKESQPGNYADGTTNPGTGNITPSTNVINVASVPLAGSLNNNFGELVGSVAGKVYNSGTNAPFAGETITLEGRDALDNPVSRTTTTDANGNYSFGNLPLSNAAGYTIKQPNQPAGSSNQAPIAGSTGGTPSNPTATSSQIVGVKVTAATPNSTANNFPETVGTLISGVVYIDADRNGALGGTDTTRILGVTVQLLAADGVTVLATKQTDANGAYSFGPADGVTEGATYFVKETQPLSYGNSGTNPGANGSSTTPTSDLIKITSVPPGGSPNNNFGELAGSVSGSVKNQTTNTPIAGVQVTLTGTDAAGKPVTLTATTDASGNYTFANVPLSGPSGYTITEPQPPGTSNGPATAGTTGGTASNPTATSSTIVGVRITGTTPATLDSTANNFVENSIIDLATATTGVNNNNGTGTFTVVTSNVGTQPAPNVRITTTLPPGLVGVVVSDGGVYNPTTGVVTWPSVPSVAPAANVTYTITVPLLPGTAVAASTNASSFDTPTATAPLAEATLANNPSTASLSTVPSVVPTLNALMLALMALLMAGAAGLRRRGQ